MMHFSNFANAAGQIKVDEWAKLAKQYNVPCMNDAAADTPPVSHLWDYANMGYDLITFSGGKAMRGPQCAGLLIGRKELVANALLNNSPHEDTLGRSQKVGKEEIIGMVKAIELYLKRRSRGADERMAEPAGLDCERTRKGSGREHVVLHARHRQSRAAYADHVGCRRFRSTPQQVSKLLRSCEAVDRDRRRRRATGAEYEFVHAARRAKRRLLPKQLRRILREHSADYAGRRKPIRG